MTAEGHFGRLDFATDIAARTDAYFNRTKQVVCRFGDKRVTYAVFVRRPVVSAPRLLVDWFRAVAAVRQTSFELDVTHPEGTWVGAGEPLVYITGMMAELSNLETIALQKIGPACVAAHNSYQMCMSLPEVAFLAMEARHCAGAEMQDMMAYAASVGSAAAQREGGARVYRQCQRRDGALVWPNARAWHDAAFARRLCRVDGACGGDVPRDVSRRADDCACGLLRS